MTTRRIGWDGWILLAGITSITVVAVWELLPELPHLLPLLDWHNLIPNLVGLWRQGRVLFMTPGTSLEALLLPAIVWLTMTFVVKELWPKPNFLSRLIVSSGLALFGIRYWLWRLFNSLNLEDFLNGTVSVVFFWLNPSTSSTPSPSSSTPSSP
ncbi:MAG: hypothetical protein RMI92_02925 [Geminocystis sp.]|nr:hypothetical protein [Geminocystis sp.]MDW8115368.1 hypothetical protein [Geminocystis sp.]MDW8462910.1 hypothetical protein [Geminocystis sp.]